MKNTGFFVVLTCLFLFAGCGPVQPDSAPSVKPSSNTIGFIGALQEDSDYSFFVVNTISANLARLGPAWESPPSADAWSPDKAELAYLDMDRSTRETWVSVVDIKGENQRKVSDLNEFFPMSWSWSGDGKSILMLCPSGGQIEPKSGGGIDERHYFDIFTLNLSSGELNRLTDTKDIGKSSLAGSPDGRKIAFSGIEHDPATWATKSYGLYIMNADGSGLDKIFSSQNSIDGLQWSPDGKKIVFNSSFRTINSTGGDIYVIDVAGRTVENLTQTPEIADYFPVWSPDGTKIAFCSGRAKQDHPLRVINAGGTEATDLYLLPDYPVGFPSWSPDGQSILFSDTHSIYSIGIDGGNLTKLLDGEGVFRDMGYPLWVN